MELPQGNPYKALLMDKIDGKITQAQMDTEIAKDVASKPEIYAFELLPPIPPALATFSAMPPEQREKMGKEWKELQYHPDVLNYSRIEASHKRNIFWLKYYIDCLNEYPDEQYKLKSRLAQYTHSVEDEDVAKQWGGSIAE